MSRVEDEFGQEDLVAAFVDLCCADVSARVMPECSPISEGAKRWMAYEETTHDAGSACS